MEITKVLKPFIRRGANTFGNIVYMKNNAQWRLRVFAHDPVTSLARVKVTAGVNESVMIHSDERTVKDVPDCFCPAGSCTVWWSLASRSSQPPSGGR